MNSGTLITDYAETDYGTFGIKFTWSQTQNIANRTSTISYTIQTVGALTPSNRKLPITSTVRTYSTDTYGTLMEYEFDSNIFDESTWKTTGQTLTSGTFTIEHSYDWSEEGRDYTAGFNLFIVFSAGWFDQWNEYTSDSPGEFNETIELDSIPGPTKISCPAVEDDPWKSAKLGSSVRFTIDRRYSSYKTTLRYQLYDYIGEIDDFADYQDYKVTEGTIVNKTSANYYVWAMPDSLTDYLSSSMGTMRIIVETYLNNTLMSPRTDYVYNVTSSEAYYPVISDLSLTNKDSRTTGFEKPGSETNKTIAEICKTPEGPTGYLQGYAELTLSGRATPHADCTLTWLTYECGLASDTISLDLVAGEEYDFTEDNNNAITVINPDSDTLNLLVTDNYNHNTQIATTISMFPYVVPQLSLDNLYLTSDDAQINPKGIIHFSLSGRIYYNEDDTSRCTFPDEESVNTMTLTYWVKKRSDNSYIRKYPITDTDTLSWTGYGFVSDNSDGIQIEVDDPDDIYAIYVVLADMITSVETPVQGVSRIPMFDWGLNPTTGETDFNFNVPITYKGKQASHIRYYEKGIDIPYVYGEDTFTKTIYWQIIENIETGLVEATIKIDSTITSWSNFGSNSGGVILRYGTPQVKCPEFPFIFDMTPSVEVTMTGLRYLLITGSEGYLYKSVPDLYFTPIRPNNATNNDIPITTTIRLSGKKADISSYIDLSTDHIEKDGDFYYIAIANYYNVMEGQIIQNPRYGMYFTTTSWAEDVVIDTETETVHTALTKWPEQHKTMQEVYDELEIQVWKEGEVLSGATGPRGIFLSLENPTSEDREIIVAITDSLNNYKVVGWGIIFVDSWPAS